MAGSLKAQLGLRVPVNLGWNGGGKREGEWGSPGRAWALGLSRASGACLGAFQPTELPSCFLGLPLHLFLLAPRLPSAPLPSWA